MTLFGEEDFQNKMDTIVKPFLQEHLQEGYFNSYDGTKIHYSYLLNPQERATIVISHGFCEFVGKYHEIMYYFYEEGYSVFFIDHRGHGFSQRFVSQLDKVHIRSYDEYVGDLKAFMDQIVSEKSLTKQYLLFAHSMGGGIAALFLERYPDYFKAAVLSSPMIQMNTGKVPKWQMGALFVLTVFKSWKYKYIPGQRGFDNIYEFERSSTLSELRYAYMFRLRQQVPEYQTYGGTCAWAKASVLASREIQKNAGKVNVPILLFQAGRDTMVLPEPQERFTHDSGRTRMIRYEGSKHEIFNATSEIREQYFREIFAFWEEHNDE